MSYLLEVIKVIGGPGSLGFLALCLAVGFGGSRVLPSARRVFHIGLALVLVSYLAMAMPAVAVGIINRLPLVAPPATADLRGVRVLVVFDGDNLAGRSRAARRFLRRASPTDVHLLGSPYLLADLRTAMRHGTRLHHDPTTWNTSAQVLRVQEISEGLAPTETAIIASRVQMPRIAALMQAAGARALLVPSDLDREPAAAGLDAVVPSYSALLASRDAIYEHAALVWYRWRGELQ